MKKRIYKIKGKTLVETDNNNELAPNEIAVKEDIVGGGVHLTENINGEIRSLSASSSGSSSKVVIDFNRIIQEGTIIESDDIDSIVIIGDYGKELYELIDKNSETLELQENWEESDINDIGLVNRYGDGDEPFFNFSTEKCGMMPCKLLYPLPDSEDNYSGEYGAFQYSMEYANNAVVRFMSINKYPKTEDDNIMAISKQELKVANITMGLLYLSPIAYSSMGSSVSTYSFSLSIVIRKLSNGMFLLELIPPFDNGHYTPYILKDAEYALELLESQPMKLSIEEDNSKEEAIKQFYNMLFRGIKNNNTQTEPSKEVLE